MTERHEHGHAPTFESLTYVCSPIHSLDPRVKIASVALLALAAVLSAPLRPAALGGLAALLVAVTVIARLPVGRVLRRTALVLPFAATIALFAPLASGGGSYSLRGLAGAYSGGGWVVAYGILSTAWVSTFLAVLLAATTPAAVLLKGLRALKVPDLFVMLLSFLYRYADALRGQIASARTALASRGFGTRGGRRLVLYGHLAGSMFVRAQERGERVYAAMLARGYDGSLPTAEALRVRPSDILVVATAALAAAAIGVYR